MDKPQEQMAAQRKNPPTPEENYWRSEYEKMTDLCRLMEISSEECEYRLEQQIKQERQYKNEAYAERNKLVRLLASLYASGIKKTVIEGWDEAWHWCVYIDMPNGQASWHFHVDDLPMFEGLPAYEGEWDGHTTEDKYKRILELAGVK